MIRTRYLGLSDKPILFTVCMPLERSRIDLRVNLNSIRAGWKDDVYRRQMALLQFNLLISSTIQGQHLGRISNSKH